MSLFGTFWSIVSLFGTFWSIVSLNGRKCHFLALIGTFWSKVSLFGTFWSIVSFNSVLWGFFQGNSLFSSLFSFPLFFFLPECEIVPELFLPIHPIFLVLIFSCYYLYYSGVFRPLCLSVHACGESCLCIHACGDHACVYARVAITPVWTHVRSIVYCYNHILCCAIFRLIWFPFNSVELVSFVIFKKRKYEQFKEFLQFLEIYVITILVRKILTFEKFWYVKM